MSASRVQPLHEIEAGLAGADIFVFQQRCVPQPIVNDLVYAFGRARLRIFNDLDICLSDALDFETCVIICDVVAIDRKICISLARLRSDAIGCRLPVLFRVANLTAWDMTRLLSFGATAAMTDSLRPDKFVARVTQSLDRADTPQDLPDTATFHAIAAAQADVIRRTLPNAAMLAKFSGHYRLDIDTLFAPKDQVGGDIWGVAPIDNRRFAVYVADFCGHGFKAGAQALRLADLLRSKDFDKSDPATALAWLNDRLAALLPRGQFAGMIYGVIDPAENSLTYACAAFPPPVIRPAAGKAWRQGDGAGLALGFRSGAEYENQRCDFSPGAGLLVYSDALIETPLPPYNVFDPDQVVDHLNAQSPQAAAADITASLRNRLGPAHNILDDLSIVALQRVGALT